MAEHRPKKPTSTRCAVYTRKSTEEGLEQAFNSLDAQREACEAYILSQRHEGWSAVPSAYDDGGFSGGSMDRPALHDLLADIRSGSVDIVVVYKVDRLTRSLSDFAKIVEIFDAYGVSFVSVTQAFNTTTSMGRLTLNVLLSFAQFEREVTAERIRDKIAASKKKGMWMGGFVPLGYDAIDKKLVVNEREAKNVCTLFDLYLEFGTISKVKAEADRLGITTKERRTRDPRMRGGGRIWRGHIHAVLTNPLYRGKIRYKGEIYEGQHDAIIDQATWDRVQARLIENARKARGRKSAGHPSLLAGLLFTEAGVPFTPSHAVKDGKRYRYYVERSRIDKERHAGAASSQTPSEFGEPLQSKHRGWRLPAHELERTVLAGIAQHLRRRDTVREFLGERAPIVRLGEALDRATALAVVLETGLPHDQLELVQDLADRVTVKDYAVAISLRPGVLVERLGVEPPIAEGDPANSGDNILITLPIALRRRGVEMKLVLSDETDERAKHNVDPALLILIAQAHDWFERMKNGASHGPADIASQDGVARTDVSRALPLAFLAPDIVRAIIEGRQPSELTSNILRRAAPSLPSSWHAQRRILGFESA